MLLPWLLLGLRHAIVQWQIKARRMRQEQPYQTPPHEEEPPLPLLLLRLLAFLHTYQARAEAQTEAHAHSQKSVLDSCSIPSPGVALRAWGSLELRVVARSKHLLLVVATLSLLCA